MSEDLMRLELARISHLMYERGYNSSINGNISWRQDNNTLLMSPSGAHLGFIQPDDFVVTDLDGSPLAKCRKQTSEYRVHVEILKARPDCRCVIHAHSPYAIAASVIGIDLNNTYISVAPVPTTSYARASSGQSVDVLRPYVQDYNWAILPRHGIVVWADSVWNAFLRVEGLEDYARVMIVSHACGPVQPMTCERRRELLNFWGLEKLV